MLDYSLLSVNDRKFFQLRMSIFHNEGFKLDGGTHFIDPFLRFFFLELNGRDYEKGKS